MLVLTIHSPIFFLPKINFQPILYQKMLVLLAYRTNLTGREKVTKFNDSYL